MRGGKRISTPMKTGTNIHRDFPGSKTVTHGKGNVFTCAVTLSGGDTVTGYGTTLESAEDTAWHGVKITLRDA